MLSEDNGSTRKGLMMKWFSEGRCDKMINVWYLNSPGITKNIRWGNGILKIGFLTVHM